MSPAPARPLALARAAAVLCPNPAQGAGPGGCTQYVSAGGTCAGQTATCTTVATDFALQLRAAKMYFKVW